MGDLMDYAAEMGFTVELTRLSEEVRRG